MKRSEFLGIVSSTLFISNKRSKKQDNLCFNTLACPDWSLKQVLGNAKKYGFKAVEIRGIKGDVNILNSPEFAKSRLSVVKTMAQNLDVKILNLNSSVVLHEYEPEKRKLNLETAKQYIDMAHELECPFVRVFPDKFPKEKSKEYALEIMKENLVELVEYSKTSKVKVLLDAHGDLVWTEDIKNLLQGIDKQHVGVIWDFFNMHLITKESPQKMYDTLKDYIEIVQLKDGFFKPDYTYEYTLMGEGEVPIREILQIIKKAKYEGFISYEWEKRWHPELPKPEVALPQFVKFMSRQ